MTDRERLIDLLDQKQYFGFATVNGTNYIQNAKIADHLISNGVVAIPFDFCPKCGRRIKNDMEQGDKI